MTVKTDIHVQIDVKQAVKWQVLRHVTRYNTNKQNTKMCSLPDSGGVLDCDSQFAILSPLSFDRPQL